jgi:DNA topoisomerase I
VTGLITYMRTDGVTIIPEAIAEIRKLVEQEYSKRYLPPFIREYKTKAKNAQEAHEAIRPTDPSRKPADVARHVERDQARLYELIWKRAVASQMASAELEQTTADINVPGRDGKAYGLRANGSVVLFDGFLRLYEEGRDDRYRTAKAGAVDQPEPEEDDSRRLPPLAQGDALKDRGIEAKQHFTEPPPRFTEATLVKRMEELGIGRPSTYASILQVLQDRGYVRIDKKRLMPEDKGRVVVGFLESFFQRYVEYDFTANLEEQLDRISNSELDWKKVLADFWVDFIGAVNEIKDLRVTHVLDALNDLLAPHIFPPRPEGGDARQCPTCGTGRLSLKLGRFGAFIGCSNYPECSFTRQMTPGANGGVSGTRVLGEDPATGLEVSLRGGRFGPYLQLGETSKEKGAEKPKRAGLPKGLAPEDVDLEKALALLALPREVGIHPEDNEPIIAGIGRFGPYVKHGKTYANIDANEDVLTVGLNRAVTLIAEKKANPGRGRRFGADPGKSLGEHPDKGGPIVVKNGRYGPYVSHAGINATLPSDMTPDTVTLEQAIGLLEARAAKVGNAPKGRRAAGRKTASGKKAASPVAKPHKPAATKPKKTAAVAANAKPARRIKAAE